MEEEGSEEAHLLTGTVQQRSPVRLRKLFKRSPQATPTSIAMTTTNTDIVMLNEDTS
jgi:hypothetical protein